MNAAEIIKKRIEIRDYLERKAKEREAEDLPYQEAVTALEGMISLLMQQQGVESIKTEFGTAYKSQVMAVKMADRDAFLDFVINTQSPQFLTSAVAKEAVKEYMDEHNSALPPGLDVTYIIKTNFRKAS